MIAARDRIIARLFSCGRARRIAKSITAPGCTAFLGLSPTRKVSAMRLQGVADAAHPGGVLVAYLIDDDGRVAFFGGEPASIAFTAGELAQLGL